MRLLPEEDCEKLLSTIEYSLSANINAIYNTYTSLGAYLIANDTQIDPKEFYMFCAIGYGKIHGLSAILEKDWLGNGSYLKYREYEIFIALQKIAYHIVNGSMLRDVMILHGYKLIERYNSPEHFYKLMLSQPNKSIGDILTDLRKYYFRGHTCNCNVIKTIDEIVKMYGN